MRGQEPVEAADRTEPAALPEAPTAPAAVRGAQRWIALLEVVLCSDFPTQLLLIQVLAIAGLQPFGPEGRLSMSYVWTLSAVDAVVLVALILFFLRLHGESPREVFLGPRPIGREALLGVLLTPLILFVTAGILGLIQRYLPWLHNVPHNPLADLMRSPLDAALFVVVAIGAGGVREEMQRAFILRRFEQHLGGGVLGLVLFSLIFGAGHLLQGWDVAITTAVLGAIWGALYLVRRSIVAPVVSHSAFNVGQIVNQFAMG